MHVLFVEPAFPANEREFVRALTQVGAAVTGIGESPASALPEDVRRQLTHYEQVRSVVDGGALYDAVRRCQQRGEAAANDAGCLAAWAESRDRFLGRTPAPEAPQQTGGQ